MANDFKRGIRIYLETSDYGKGIDAMVAATQKYEKKLEELKTEAERMTAAGQNQGKAWDDNQKKLKQVEAQLKKSEVAEADYRAKLQQTEKVLNNLSGVSYNELVAVQKQLQKELKDTTRGTDLHKTKLEQLERVNKEVSKAQGEMNSNLGKSGSFFGKAADGFNRYFNLGISFIAGITGLSMAFRKLAEDVAHMDDVYSDVMKTTGMTREEVLALNEEMKKLDTRTTRESLNNLARDAGKLGIEGTKNILDFVDAGNQINVALGEDLGEDAIKNIGKMVGVFEKSTKQLQGIGLKEQMLAVGSAVNELGASSTASEPYLVSFAGRLGGISKQAKISMADILGFASALDQDMQQVEMSATALQQFIMKVMGDPGKFAKLAGLEVGKFSKLLETDANAAIKQVLRALNEKGGFQALIPIFQELGLDGARAVGVLSTMAGSIDKIDEAQRVSNEAMTEGTSITKEYAIKNNNLAAELDKARKKFKETALELGEKLNPVLLKSTKGTTYLIKALAELPKWLRENWVTLLALTGAIAYYTIGVNASIIADKLKVFWTEKVLLSFKNLTTAIKTNPWGIVATGLILAIGWLNKYLNKQREVNTEQQKFNDLAEKSKEIQTGNKSLEDRIKLMKSLSKTQLETLKSDLETQISEMDKFDADVKTRAQKALDEDEKYNELKRKFFNARNELEKASFLAQVTARENYLLDQLAKEYTTNERSLKNMRKYLGDVNALLKTKPDNKGGGFTPVESGTDNNDAFEKALKEKDVIYKNAQLELLEQRRKGEISEEVMNDIAMQNQLQFLEEKLKLQKKYGKETIDTEIEISNQKSKIQKDADAAIIKATKETEEAGISILEGAYSQKKEMLSEALTLGEISQKEFNREMKKADVEFYTAKLELAEATFKALELANLNDKELQKKLLDEQLSEIKKLKDQLQKAGIALAKDTAKEVEKNTETVAERMKKIFGNTFDSIGDLFANFTQSLEALKKGDLQSWEDWGMSIGGIVQASLAVATQINDQYYQYKAAALETDKQRELTAAGENAEAREAVTQKYAQKELDLKKKQSSADTVLKVAQAMTAGALAIMQAFAQLGPVGGAIASLFVGSITGLQVATILKQNAAIQATTLDSTVSGSSVSGTTQKASSGARVANQAADGRWDVIGADDGRTYRNVPYRGVARTGIVTVPTLMGEAGDEAVIDNPTLRNIRMNAPWVLDTIMQLRVPQRADGNYSNMPTGKSTNMSNQLNSSDSVAAMNIKVMERLIILIQWIIDNGIDANVYLDKLEKKMALKNKSIQKGSR